MAAKTMSGEQMLDVLADCKAIEKMINKRSFLGLLRQSDQNWRDFWCGAEAEPVLGLNNGYYKGYAAVGAYYEARHRLAVLKTALARKAYPELADKSPEEIHGAGSLVMDNLSTQVLEIAGDGETAKGLWYVVTTDIDLGVSGEEARWQWGRIGVDFIREAGQWKIWHMMYAEDINSLMGYDWTKEPPEIKALPEFAEIADFRLPEPNVPCVVHEGFYRQRPVKPIPQVPLPYDTFKETFSYTIM